jgi:hypothetical protein
VRYSKCHAKGKNIKHLNHLITRNEIEAVIKSLPTRKNSGPEGLTAEFCQFFKEELIPILLTLFQEIES